MHGLFITKTLQHLPPFSFSFSFSFSFFFSFLPFLSLPFSFPILLSLFQVGGYLLFSLKIGHFHFKLVHFFRFFPVSFSSLPHHFLNNKLPFSTRLNQVFLCFSFFLFFSFLSFLFLFFFLFFFFFSISPFLSLPPLFSPSLLLSSYPLPVSIPLPLSPSSPLPFPLSPLSSRNSQICEYFFLSITWFGKMIYDPFLFGGYSDIPREKESYLNVLFIYYLLLFIYYFCSFPFFTALPFLLNPVLFNHPSKHPLIHHLLGYGHWK